jgi:Amt family ammonium transporter
MSSGYAALVAAKYLGHSAKHADTSLFEVHEPANVPIVVLGTALLWFGWFGVSTISSLNDCCFEFGFSDCQPDGRLLL